ncbi:MAG: acyl-CoA dehydrogenase [Deltaproteobacteria bacterium]|jgi:acyl-CoA dehydrogenase|nr:MAG: acyl-CoA dehydrogenase [Deltaproteobacteria bacterium]
MDFQLSSEHLSLKESVASFVKKDHSFDRLRHLRNDPLGYSKEVWKKMAELGWMGLIYPEEYGGLELDFAFVMVLLEEFGRGLLPEPWISNVLLGGNLVLMGGSESQKHEVLPGVISGDLMITAAYLENDGRYDINFCATSAEQRGDAYFISGKKIFVLDGLSADRFVITARTSESVADKDGITLFMVSSRENGVKLTPLKTMDGRNACILELKDVSVPGSNVIGEVGRGYPLLFEAIDHATAGLCAEMVGGMQASIDLTVAYLSERTQFGKPIGTFQTPQHKAADMFIQKELAVSSVYYAIASIDEKTDERALAVSIAKTKCSSAYMEITKAAVQLFGGIGFTNEGDIGFFLKRAKVSEILFGDTDYHLDRYTRLSGY